MGERFGSMGTAAVIFLVAFLGACAGGPGPAEGGSGDRVSGPYTGRLIVAGQTFDARLDLRSQADGRVGGSFLVRSPVEIEGRVAGVVMGELLRLEIRYEGSGRSGCDGRIEGILTLEPGGRAFEGPVTTTDCNGALSGSMSFRR